MIAETKHVVSSVKYDPYELLHVELRLELFKVIEVFFPNRGTAFHFYSSAMPIIAFNDNTISEENAIRMSVKPQIVETLKRCRCWTDKMVYAVKG